MEKQFMKKRIDDKIFEIELYLQELEEIKTGDFEEYIKDIKTKAAYERYAEKIIGAVEDLAFLIINYRGLKYPEYEKEIFDILYKNNIISDILAKKLKNAKGMRNILAHEYGKVEDELVFEAIAEQLIPDTEEFIKSVEHNI